MAQWLDICWLEVKQKEQMMTNTETATTESSVSETVAALKGIPTRDELMETLRKEVVEVTFLKLDGAERKMPCTLITSFLPPAKKDDPMSQKKVREVSDKVCAVWAIESKGFRSFRYDRVTNVKILDEAKHKEQTIET
jgi:hypothetical protein|tara:strand:+ start:516 stop:929 length:414 start_codon:yes stop_codon:yes gene_type:complete